MLVTPRGTPIPPESSQALLRAVDPRLSLRWVDGVVRYWAIVEKWRDRDPRRERIQQGELSPDGDFDVKCFLPPDCSPEEVEGYILRNFVRVTDPAKQAEEAMLATARHNDAVMKKNLEVFDQEQLDKTIRTTKHDLEVQMGVEKAHPMVMVEKNIGKGKKAK